jgi:O-antigen/teichoic acid export membrane protein
MVKLARASAVSFTVNIAETVVGMPATLYFARALGAGLMGSYFLAMGLANWILIPSGGLSSVLVKRISETHDQKEYFVVGTLLLLSELSRYIVAIRL